MTASVEIALIAAVAENGVIGADGRMPWRLSTDMQRFRRLTIGKPVIMGRATWESLGKPLPDRVNIVVTRQQGWRADGAVTAASIDAAVALASEAAGALGASEIMVIGGGTIYAETIGRAARLYITHVAARPEGDTHFPPIDPAVWAVEQEESVPAGERDSAATRFVVYRRKGR